MNLLNSTILLCKNINIDKSYKNVLDYSETDMLNLCNSSEHLLASSTHYSFIEHGVNSIKVNFSYSTCLEANYIAFQNTDYSSKWFFAFIESVKYLNDGVTQINYIVDAWSTWFNLLTPKACFVIREHVTDDTLGRHTIPEGLELGDYIVNSHLEHLAGEDLCIIMGTSEDIFDNYNFGINNYNGIPQPLFYNRYNIPDDMTALASALTSLASDSKSDTIISMFLCPKWLASEYVGNTKKVLTSDVPVSQELGISRISALNGYTPKNNKLLCYPYCYVALSNVVGQYNIYKQELWSLSNNEMKLKLYGALSNGCSIRAVPLNYNGNEYAFDDSISIGKYPQLAWFNDLYTNWQTQNGVNILGMKLTREQAGIISGGLQTAFGAYTGNFATIGSGIGQIFGTMQESYRHDLVPTAVDGSLNTADVINAMRKNTLHLYRVTIKREYAEAIDDFFNHFGYKITKVKVPALTGRKYWNFIQIGESEEIGYGSIPNEYLDTINQIARAGVTIWHSHDNIGNYALNNTII